MSDLSYQVLPQSTIAISNTIALDFAKQMVGPVGGLCFALVVAMSCFGALNGKFIGQDSVCS